MKISEKQALKSQRRLASEADGSRRLNRLPSNYFSTPADVTISLMEYLFNLQLLTSESKIWEPAAGEGVMSKVLEIYCPTTISSERRSGAGLYGLQRMDFLTYRKPAGFDIDAIITFPPPTSAEEFVAKAGRLKVKIVAMLLPIDFFSDSKRIELFNAFEPNYILPLTWKPQFESKKEDSTLGSLMWCIWESGNVYQSYKPLKKNRNPKHFKRAKERKG